MTENQIKLKNLASAICNYDIGRIKLLLEDESLDLDDSVEHTPRIIHYCSFIGVPQITTLILNKNIDINYQSSWLYSKTTLIISVQNGYFDHTKLLLERGAQINLKDTFGRTALIHACIYGYIKIVRLLLRYGADINIRDIHDKNALDYAREQVFYRIENILNNLEKEI